MSLNSLQDPFKNHKSYRKSNFLEHRCPSRLLVLGLGNSTMHLVYYYCFRLKVCQWWPKLAWGNESEMGRSYIRRNEWNPEELVKAYNTLSTCPWWWRSISEDWRFTLLTWIPQVTTRHFKVHEWAALLTELSELIASLWVFPTNS